MHALGGQIAARAEDRPTLNAYKFVYIRQAAHWVDQSVGDYFGAGTPPEPGSTSGWTNFPKDSVCLGSLTVAASREGG